MRAMVLCAGFGTRLRPLTDKVPKPLVPLCGLPLLRYNFALLKNAGVEEIVVNTHHLGPLMEQGARELARELAIDLQLSREEKQILGTGGGVRRAEKLLGNGTFYLLNGDMIFDVDLGAALAAHRKAGAVATMVLAPYPRGATYGAVEVDAAMNVRRIAGRGAAPEPSLIRAHFTGVHILEPPLVARLPAEGESDINRTAYVRAAIAIALRASSDRKTLLSPASTPATYLSSGISTTLPPSGAVSLTATTTNKMPFKIELPEFDRQSAPHPTRGSGG